VPSPLESAVARCWKTAPENPAEALRIVEPLLDGGAGPAAAAAELRLCRGYAREQLGDRLGARGDYEWTAAEAERLGDRKLLASALSLRGESAYYRGDFTAALEDLNRAQGIELELGREHRQLYNLTAIANVYADARVGAYERAIEYYRKVLAAHQAAGRQADMATAHFNLGSTYERMGKPAEALAELERAVEIDRRRGDPDEVAFNERAIASLLIQLGRPREALARLAPALDRFTATANEELLAHARLTRGIARRALGDLDGALDDLDAAARHFRQEGNDRFLVRVEEERAEALAAKGDAAAALAARTSQVELERRLAETVRDEHTSRLRVQFETEQKERDNQALHRENELRRAALADAERIRDLQRAVLLLAAVLLAVLVALALRQLARARRLHRLAMTDELTRLPNRRAFFAHAEEALEHARRGGEPLALLALDIDHFKRINDTLGHEAGDRVLQRVAGAARSALRDGDVVGRTGGEEFLALLPATPPAAAAEVAERLRAAVQRLDLADLAPDLAVSVSVGVAGREDGASSVGAIVQRADEALYRAKAGGRNRVELAPATPSPR
jgi:diguanylate cyclase (GGDEF)-like protein